MTIPRWLPCVHSILSPVIDIFVWFNFFPVVAYFYSRFCMPAWLNFSSQSFHVLIFSFYCIHACCVPLKTWVYPCYPSIIALKFAMSIHRMLPRCSSSDWGGCKYETEFPDNIKVFSLGKPLRSDAQGASNGLTLNLLGCAAALWVVLQLYGGCCS